MAPHGGFVGAENLAPYVEGVVEFSTSAGLAFGTMNGSGVLAERVRITATGNVGIGTAAPNSKFSVIPTATPSTVATANQITIGEATNNAAYGMALGYASLAANSGVIQVNGGGALCPLLLNPSGGNVGIGTGSRNLLTVIPATTLTTIAATALIRLGKTVILLGMDLI